MEWNKWIDNKSSQIASNHTGLGWLQIKDYYVKQPHYCLTALRLLSGEYRCLVLVDSVEDIYVVGASLFPLVLILDNKNMYIPLSLAVLSLISLAVTNVNYSVKITKTWTECITRKKTYK